MGSASTCLQKGCCFDNSIQGTKWCFKKKEAAGECTVHPSERKECGWAEIGASTCRQRGCCFDSSVANTKWCFQKAAIAPAKCAFHNVHKYEREQCGHHGISRFDCYKKGCCYDNSFSDAIFCYRAE